MVPFEKKISTFVKQQFPRFYDDEGPVFIEFVRYYYKWLEQTGNIIDLSRSLPDYWDVDKTLVQFLDHFQNTYLHGIPETIKADKRFMVKHILDVYRSKGTIQGYKLLFRLLFNDELDVYLPSVDIFRVSDGKWTTPKYLEVSDSDVSFSLVRQLIVGSASGAEAIVEDFIRQTVNNKVVNILYISNISGDFTIGERVYKKDEEDVDVRIASPVILGSITNIGIVSGGQSFFIGDNLQAVSGSGVETEVRVAEVGVGVGSLGMNLIDGGTLYTTNALSMITRAYTNVIPRAGSGASFNVVDLTNQRSITFNTDLLIDYYTKPYSSGNVRFVNVVSGGTGYTNGASVTFTSVSYVGLIQINNQGSLYSNSDTITLSGGTSTGSGKIVTNGSGAIIAVDITNPGRGFAANITPSITTSTGSGASLTGIVSNTGSGAVATVNTNGSGVITSVTVTNGGTLYTVSPLATVAGGTGASLQANSYTDYGFDSNVVLHTTDMWSTLGNLNFQTASFGTIGRLGNIKTGDGYTLEPTIKARDLMVPKTKPSGTLTYSNTSANIVGVGTSFTTFFENNTPIMLTANTTANTGIEFRYIVSVANNTFMTIDDYPVNNSTASAKITIAPTIIRANFSVQDGLLLASNNSVQGENELIKGGVSTGGGIVTRLEVKNSGFGYDIDGEIIEFSLKGTVASVNVVSGGTGYSNGENLTFIGGSPVTQAQGKIFTNSNGVITSVNMTYTGSNYKTTPTIRVINSSGSGANLVANIGALVTNYQMLGTAQRGAVGTSRGRWKDTSGFPSTDKHIQDSFYYQEYSYELRSGVSIDRYINMIRKFFHVAGTEVFGKVILKDTTTKQPTISKESISTA
jgi:hypothetical protein